MPYSKLVDEMPRTLLRGVVPGGAGGAMAPPDFGRSVNPISTRGDRLCPPNYYWHPRIFRPSDGPVIRYLFYKYKGVSLHWIDFTQISTPL